MLKLLRVLSGSKNIVRNVQKSIIRNTRFRFCGDSDCPDWVLAEINSSLSALSSVKLRVVAQSIAKNILGGEMLEERIQEFFVMNKPVNSPPKSATACIRFLLVSAAKYSADQKTFSEELQLLGLPKEHSEALRRVLVEYMQEIQNRILTSSLTVNELDDVSAGISKNTSESVQLELSIANEIVGGVTQRTSHKININHTDLLVFLNDLTQIKYVMDGMNFGKKYENV